MGVTRFGEVQLLGNYYPIIGPVKEGDAAQWAPKTVTGDWTKDSQKLASSVVWSDFRAGIGIKDMVEGKDDNRCYFSTCEIGFKGHLVAPPKVTNCTNPTTNLDDCLILIAYNSYMYACFGTSVRRWLETTQTWTADLRTLGGTPTGAFVHQNRLYIAIGTDFERYTASTDVWTTGTTLSGGAVATRYLTEWDGKLFGVSNTGQLWFSTDEGVTITNSALSTLKTGSFTSLFIGPDNTGRLMPKLGTKLGTFFLDFDGATWVESGLFFPEHAQACLGANVWRGAEYVSVGNAVFQYQGGSPPTIKPVGPDLDYGLPADYRGNIVALVGEHNHLYALLDATTTEEQNLYSATYLAATTFYDNVGFSAVLKWNGVGWGVVYISSNLATAAKAITVATTDSTYRLWFAINETVFYTPLNVNLVNPLEIEDSEYQTRCTHTDPWFDANNAVIDKTAFGVTAYVERVSASAYVMLYYGVDGDDNTWTLLTNSTFTDGHIDVNGEATFTFASGAGLSFKSIRFKKEVYATATASPDVRWLRLDYLKLLTEQYSWGMTLDCIHAYRHKRASTLVAAVQTAYETHTLGAFTYRSPNGVAESHQVKVMQFGGASEAGKEKRGQYKVVLVAV